MPVFSRENSERISRWNLQRTRKNLLETGTLKGTGYSFRSICGTENGNVFEETSIKLEYLWHYKLRPFPVLFMLLQVIFQFFYRFSRVLPSSFWDLFLRSFQVPSLFLFSYFLNSSKDRVSSIPIVFSKLSWLSPSVPISKSFPTWSTLASISRSNARSSIDARIHDKLHFWSSAVSVLLSLILISFLVLLLDPCGSYTFYQFQGSGISDLDS